MRPAITSVSKRYGSQVRNQPRNYTTSRQVDYSTKNLIKQRENPIYGPPKPPRYIGSGVQGQGSLPGPLGPRGGGGAPQVGGGDVAKSSNPSSGQKTTGTSTNPYGRTTPPGQSPKDALTKALLQSILNDRKRGEQAVKRNPETKKVESIDQTKLDEKTKAEISKLSEAFQKDALELEKSIKDFQKRFEKQLDETPEDRNLDGILDKVVDEAKSDKMKNTLVNEDGERVINPDFNPQGFIDAADELDQWIKDNPETAAKYGDDLTQLNDEVQRMRESASEQIALAENSPRTLLDLSDRLGEEASTETQSLQDQIDELGADATGEDRQNIDQFKQDLDATMEAINPGDDAIFNPEAAGEALSQLKTSHSKLPEEIRENPEFKDSFEKIADLSKDSIDSQIQARTEEPDSAKFEQSATELVQGQDRVDANLAEHFTPEQREDIVEDVVGPEAIEEARRQEAAEQGSDASSSSDVQAPTNPADSQRLENLGAEFAQDDAEGIAEETRGDSTAVDLDVDVDVDLDETTNVDEAAADATEEAAEEAVEEAIEEAIDDEDLEVE